MGDYLSDKEVVEAAIIVNSILPRLNVYMQLVGSAHVGHQL